jgi:hypothetical protein
MLCKLLHKLQLTAIAVKNHKGFATLHMPCEGCKASTHIWQWRAMHDVLLGTTDYVMQSKNTPF